MVIYCSAGINNSLEWKPLTEIRRKKQSGIRVAWMLTNFSTKGMRLGIYFSTVYRAKQKGKVTVVFCAETSSASVATVFRLIVPRCYSSTRIQKHTFISWQGPLRRRKIFYLAYEEKVQFVVMKENFAGGI